MSSETQGQALAEKRKPRRSTGNGTVIGYSVQVRSKGRPVAVRGLLVGREWYTVSTYHDEVRRVPNPIWSPLAAEQGLMTYATATAIMATFAATAGVRGYELEYRLVKKELTYSWSIESKGVGQPVNFDSKEHAAEFTPAEED